MKAPAFWYRPRGLLAYLLMPLGGLFRVGGFIRRAVATPYRAKIPVICIGNIVAGGAGKTPTAMAVARMLLAKGAKPVFVTRGYGGRVRGPVRVDPARHTADDVGDEALLLAPLASVWVGRNRAAAVRAAELHATHIILDDGLQNPTIHPDISLLVIDGEVGLGNTCLIPAGPLRETLNDVLKRVRAIVVIGRTFSTITSTQVGSQRHAAARQKDSSAADTAGWIPASAGMTMASIGHCPIIHAQVRPDLSADFPRHQRFLAFAGIGRPEKFYKVCRAIGLTIVGTRDFPDHHKFTRNELAELCTSAAAQNAHLLTTEKDWVRLPPDSQALVSVLPVRLAFEDEADVWCLITKL